MKRPLFFLFGFLALAAGDSAQAQVRIFGGGIINGGNIIINGNGELTDASTPPAAAKGDIQLHWQNGEALGGTPLEASETELFWKTPLFDEPLRVRWDALRRIDRVLPSAPVTEPFAVRLRDGSHLYGDVKEVAAESVKMHSERHGDFSVNRAEILTMRRLHGGSLTAAGPTGDVGWKEEKPPSGQPSFRRISAQLPAQPLVAGPAGSLVFPFWNSGAVYQVALPAQVVVEFRVRSNVKPDFRLTLNGEGKQSLQIETWDEDLVAVSNDEFRALRKVAETDREIALRICWDRPGRRCVIYTAAGDKLADWKLPEGAASPGLGLSLVNKGQNLTLEFLRVREWEGDALGPVDLKSPGLELGDGRFVGGQIGEGADDRLGVKLPSGELSERFPMGAVDGIVFSPDPPAATPPAAKVTYADGTVLVGRVASFKENVFAIKTGFSSEPIRSRFEGMRELALPADAAKAVMPKDVDELVLQQITMHGKLTGAGTDSPRWVPVGGTTPVSIAKSAQYYVTRSIGAASDPNAPSPPALFYTSTGDVLPGTLRSLDRTGVEMTSPIMEATKLPAASLSAIQFGIATPRAINGFRDPGWRVLKGTDESVTRTDTELKMKPDTSIGHPSALAGDEITFEAAWSGYASMRMRLFCDGMEASKGTGLILGMFGENWMTGIETNDGNLENQIQTRVTGKTTKVRLVIREKAVELYLNGGMIQSFLMDSSKRAGSGLIIEPAGLWGNPVSPLTLTNFAVRAATGRTWLPDVSREVKSQALTIPRFRREDPPRHALLAGNGDVLRGEVEALTNTQIAFRSGLEDLRVPLDRVKAIIWLQPPLKDAKPPTAEAKAEETLLDHKVQRRSRYRNANLASMMAMIMQEIPELQFQPPPKDDLRRSFDFGGQTVREILDQICPLFGVRYRVEGGKKIIFENLAGASSGGLVTTVYWLKPGALSNTSSAQEVLKAKGVAFPPGTYAQWQADSGQLTMSNTADAHAKVAALLKADFGGSLGSPTHWIQMVSGARLALTVDKFDKDAIVGRHPVYGKCRVPLADIFAVRTTPPDPTSAMRSLQGWRLVNAPEPVIEGSDGSGSALVGKDAPTFRVPMLAGDTFDLAAQKGKVVILDFWATWCGPCIKSLPGLIEAMAPFPADKVQFIGLNQSEPADLVKRFLETRGWKLTVGLDAGGKVGQQYGVEGIPTTVIIAPDGKIAMVKVGYDPSNEKEISEAVKKLLAPPAAAAPVP